MCTSLMNVLGYVLGAWMLSMFVTLCPSLMDAFLGAWMLSMFVTVCPSLMNAFMCLDAEHVCDGVPQFNEYFYVI